MPNEVVVKNMTDANLRKYAELIIRKAKANANTAIESYVTAQNFTKMATIIGHLSGIANPDTKTFYIQKDSPEVTSWNLYIYMKTGSDPDVFTWVKLNANEADLSGYVQTSAISFSDGETADSNYTIPTSLKVANDIEAATDGLFNADNIIASTDSETAAADTNVYSASKTDDLLAGKEDTKDAFTDEEIAAIVNSAADDAEQPENSGE